MQVLFVQQLDLLKDPVPVLEAENLAGQLFFAELLVFLDNILPVSQRGVWLGD